MSKPTIDVSAIIEAQKPSRFIFRLVLISWVITFFDGFDMNAIAYVAPALAPAFHLDKYMLGNIFSVGLAGTMIGGFGFGVLGDRIGRRPAIILAAASFGLLTLGLALTRNYGQFLVLRLLDGIAIGGMLPLCWALNIEYAPRRFRSTIVTVIMIGYTMGFSSAGPVSIWLVPHHGWQSVFVFGALGSLVAAVMLYVVLPESIRYLVGKGRHSEAIAAILRRMAPTRTIAPNSSFILADEVRTEAGFKISLLFKDDLRWITPLLWLGYTASSLGIFFMASWGPTILESLGYTRSTAALVSAANSIGGAMGALILMRFTDRRGAISLSVLPAIAIPIMLFCGLATIGQSLFLVLSFFGAAMLGSTHFGFHSIAGIYYPSAYRGMGAGWATSIAKFGSVAGPLVGGVILSSHLPVKNVYALLAICPMIICVCTFILGRRHSALIRRDRLARA